MTITITEALAEIKTIGKRLNKKRESIYSFLARQEGVRDPLEKEGGSPQFIQQERQGITDLEDRIIALRRGIQHANDETQVTINGDTRTISEWLTFRRDVAPGRRAWLDQVRGRLSNMRDSAKKQGVAMISATAISSDVKPTDFVINLDEVAIARELEQLEDTLGQLDGQLSLKNATVMIKE